MQTWTSSSHSSRVKSDQVFDQVLGLSKNRIADLNAPQCSGSARLLLRRAFREQQATRRRRGLTCPHPCRYTFVASNTGRQYHATRSAHQTKTSRVYSTARSALCQSSLPGLAKSNQCSRFDHLESSVDPWHASTYNIVMSQIPMNFLRRLLDAFIDLAACGGILYVGIHIGYLLHGLLY